MQLKTKEYREENNDFFNWLDENVEYKENGLLKLGETCQLYLNKAKVHSKETSKYKKEIQKYIKARYPNLKWEYGVVKVLEKSYNGWKNITIKD